MRHFPDLQVHNRITGAAFSMLLGVEFGAILIPAITYLMESTSDAIRGRIFALLYMVINGVSAIPVLIAAALADNIGTAQVLGGLGILLLGGGVGLIAGGLRAPAPQPGPTQSPREP
jgi:MFS family permease